MTSNETGPPLTARIAFEVRTKFLKSPEANRKLLKVMLLKLMAHSISKFPSVPITNTPVRLSSP
jgi:hypothetical protein